MRSVLITGSTGAIGSKLVPLFLDEENTRLHLLIRARDEAHLQRRFDELCAFWGRDPKNIREQHAIQIWKGDMGAERLGLEKADYERLASEVTHVIHGAANLKLNRPWDEARAEAVQAVHRVAAFCRACMAKNAFEKLEYLSTISATGRLTGRIRECPLPDAGYRNSYEAAKAAAETALLEAMRGGLPATIHRPAMVVGDSRTGGVNRFQIFYYIAELLSGRKTWGVVPRIGTCRLDLIPVDWVARAIYLSTCRPDARGRIFHLCTGPGGMLSLDQIAERVRRYFANYMLPLPKTRVIPKVWFERLLPMLCYTVSSRTRRALATVPLLLAYADLDQEYENVETRAFFGAALPPPPAADDFWDAMMGFYCRERYARAT